jgi:hypothetical protein
MAILAVFPRWHTFGAVRKVDAILFLLLLVITPIFEFDMTREGGRD